MLSTSVSNNEKINFKIYPNPAQNEIKITTSHQNINITIFTITGKKIIETNAKKINTSNFAKGCYIIEIKNKNGFSMRKKLIIK